MGAPVTPDEAPVPVAVVDDHPLFRSAVVAAFEGVTDMTVAMECGSVEELEARLDAAPDAVKVVLLDLSLPGCDGLSAAFRMREVGAMCDVPIVACTAHDAALHRGAALAAGCDEYLTKPLDMGRLKEVVGRLLAERSEGARKGAAEARARRIASARLDDEGLRDYLEGLMERNGAPE